MGFRVLGLGFGASVLARTVQGSVGIRGYPALRRGKGRMPFGQAWRKDRTATKGKEDMVVSLNRGTPIRDPQKSTPDLGNCPIDRALYGFSEYRPNHLV